MHLNTHSLSLTFAGSVTCISYVRLLSICTSFRLNNIYERENRLFAAFFFISVLSYLFHFHIYHWYPLYSIHGTFECIALHHIKTVEHWMLFLVLFVKLKYITVGTLHTQSHYICTYIHINMNEYKRGKKQMLKITKHKLKRSLFSNNFFVFFASYVGMHHNLALKSC